MNTRFHVIGMDCGSCAAKVDKAVRSVGIDDHQISTTTQTLTLRNPLPDTRLQALDQAVTAAGYTLQRQDDPAAAHHDPAYRRALWIVVALNGGYGVIEMLGGILSGSQAVKADALDFLGDGLITWLGLLAIGWSLLWRARAALIQGVFLALLGLGILVSTGIKLTGDAPVEAGVMGVLGLIALVVNMASALALLPHRKGDANLRAVWLFSRNDAIGNAAVVLAALTVGATGQVWPDHLVAFGIAGLFLQSAWVIIRDARNELYR